MPPRSTAVRSLLTLVAVVAIGLGLGAPSTSARAEPAKTARLRATIPAAASTGDLVAIRGRILGGRRGRVTLQQRVRGRWRFRGRSRATGRRARFVLRWRAPRKRSVVVLRVAAGVEQRPFAVSRPRRVAISPTTVLKPGRVLAAPAPGEEGTLRYRGRVDLRAGEYVALGVGDATPLGLLGRVTSVEAAGGETHLGVTPASLIEAIPAGHIDISGTADASGKPKAEAAADPRSFSSNFSCDGSASAELSGSLAVSLEPRFRLDWGFSWRGPRVNSAEASATVRGDAQLSAKVSARGSCELAPTQVASWAAPAIKFTIGPFPVVIVPVTALYVSGSGEVSGAAETGVSGFVSATAGLRYDGEDVRPIGGFDHGFSHTPLASRLDASLGGRVTPSVTFLLYGLAGPRFDLTTGLQLDAGVSRQPPWTLSAPIDLTAQLVVPRFEKFNAGPVSVYSTRLVIAESGPQPDHEPHPPPGPGERARIIWDTDGTDVDLHIWDAATGEHAWYSDQDGIWDAELSSDITTGYGPEWFTDYEDPSTRSFVYGLCYYDDEGVGPTDVAMRIIDPDGTVRNSNHVLYATGDNLLVGSSPPGSGFVPTDGWCRG
jgi:hypothetical protein